jgi:hypothetical protein
MTILILVAIAFLLFAAYAAGMIYGARVAYRRLARMTAVQFMHWRDNRSTVWGRK